GIVRAEAHADGRRQRPVTDDRARPRLHCRVPTSRSVNWDPLNWVGLIVGLVALERLAELIYARRNTSALLHAGAYEIGRNHYPLIVLLHLSWLIAVYAL